MKINVKYLKERFLIVTTIYNVTDADNKVKCETIACAVARTMEEKKRRTQIKNTMMADAQIYETCNTFMHSKNEVNRDNE